MALSLGRKPGESFKIRLPDGRLIEVKIKYVRRGGYVSVSIDAPSDVNIFRTELEGRHES